MRTLIHNSEFGIIEYRLPTIPEMVKMMESMKPFRDTKDETGAIDWMIGNLASYVVNVDLVIENETIKSWNDVLNYSELFNDLMTISNLIIEKTFNRNVSKKK